MKFNTKTALKAIIFITILLLPQLLMAATAGGTFKCGTASTTITSFFSSIEGLIGIASISIVTIAIIIAGYQIAFAHKRISDVAPILVGGLLIGGAGAIATMLMSGGTGSIKC
jgi:type IV secretion system protein VirB2